MQRIIGSYTGKKAGALVVAMGAVHGNESAGVEALKTVFALLEKEPEQNPGFEFKGKLIGIIGNLQAYGQGQRFIREDLNRLWTKENVERICATDPSMLEAESLELYQIHQLIQSEINCSNPQALVLLDLHTTSAEGGIFCLPSNSKASLRLAKELHAPVILGMLDGIEGTILKYAQQNPLGGDCKPAYTVGVAFEGGQHYEELSTSRCIAAILNCLRASGCVEPADVDTRHDEILLHYSNLLPKVTRLEYIHPVKPADYFRMKPGYTNFQSIEKGEHLADDVNGPVTAPRGGRILMPLYQPQGSDGFFIVEDMEEPVI